MPTPGREAKPLKGIPIHMKASTKTETESETEHKSIYRVNFSILERYALCLSLYPHTGSVVTNGIHNKYSKYSTPIQNNELQGVSYWYEQN